MMPNCCHHSRTDALTDVIDCLLELAEGAVAAARSAIGKPFTDDDPEYAERRAREALLMVNTIEILVNQGLGGLATVDDTKRVTAKAVDIQRQLP